MIAGFRAPGSRLRAVRRQRTVPAILPTASLPPVILYRRRCRRSLRRDTAEPEAWSPNRSDPNYTPARVTPTSFPIRFLPDDRTYEADAAVELYLAAAAVGILVEQPCGSRGTCGRCRVRVVEGAPTPTEADRARFTAEELDAGWRLSCQLRLSAPAIVDIPSVTRSLAGKSFGDDLPPQALTRPVVHVGSVRAPLLAGETTASSMLDALGTSAGLVDRALTASPSALADLASADAVADMVTVAIHGRELVLARAGRVESFFGLADRHRDDVARRRARVARRRVGRRLGLLAQPAGGVRRRRHLADQAHARRPGRRRAPGQGRSRRARDAGRRAWRPRSAAARTTSSSPQRPATPR